MPRYITLINYTQKGIENIKDGPARLDQARQAFKARGAEILEYYLVSGRYDAVAILEAPDDDTVAKLALTIGSAGAIRTETLRAWPEADYRKVIADL